MVDVRVQISRGAIGHYTKSKEGEIYSHIEHREAKNSDNRSNM